MRLHLYLGTKDQDLICFQNRIKDIQGLTFGRIINDMISAYIKNEIYILPFRYENNEDRLAMANRPVNLSIFLDIENENFLNNIPERGKNHFIKELIRTNLNRMPETERKSKTAKHKTENLFGKTAIKVDRPKNKLLNKDETKSAITIAASVKKESKKRDIQITKKEAENVVLIDESDYDDVEDNLIALSGADEY